MGGKGARKRSELRDPTCPLSGTASIPARTPIAALDAQAGARLQAALNADAGVLAPATAVPARDAEVAGAVRAPVQPGAELAGERSTVELLVYRMADELDLSPRRMRGAFVRLLRSLRATGLSFERAERELEAWLQPVS